MKTQMTAPRYRVKDEEKARLWNEIREKRQTTRKVLALSLGLRPNSVSVAVQELKEDGLVTEETEAAEGRTGRPGWIIKPNLDRFTAVSYYVDGRSLKCGLVNLGGEILALESKTLPQESSSAELGAAVRGLFHTVEGKVPSGSELTGIGISLVGTVQPLSHIWMNAARWPRLSKLDISKVFEGIALPLAVRRNLDTELDHLLDTDPDYRNRNVALFHWGYGVGTAFAYRGNILSSSLGRFGEIGHTRTAGSSGKPCLCGGIGCLETETALWALMPEIEKACGSLPDDEEEMIKSLPADMTALPAITRAADLISAALSTYYKLFYPDVILLAGPFFALGGIYDRVVEGLLASLPQYAKETVRCRRLDEGFSGCLTAGVNMFFENTLSGYLVARN